MMLVTLIFDPTARGKQSTADAQEYTFPVEHKQGQTRLLSRSINEFGVKKVEGGLISANELEHFVEPRAIGGSYTVQRSVQGIYLWISTSRSGYSLSFDDIQ